MGCCQLVGTLNITPANIFSIQVQSSTEAQKIEGVVIEGPTMGTVMVSGWASLEPHTACPGRAGVSIDWVKKYDCDNDIVYIIFSGAGQSYENGDNEGMVTINNKLSAAHKVLNASITNDPTAMYEDSITTNGFGMSYSGGPIPFSIPDDAPPPSFSVGGLDNLYLQNFSLQCTPGQVPVASYTFIYLITAMPG